MLTGHLPFSWQVDGELKRRILRGAFSLPEHISPEGRDLVRLTACRLDRCRLLPIRD